MSDWWEMLEAALEERSETAPDPWGDLGDDDEASALTPEQEAFLRQIAEQPHPGRYVHDDDD